MTDPVFTFHFNRADNIYELAPAEWAKVREHIARLQREHIEDVNRMERAAIAIEDMTRQLNQRAAHEPPVNQDCSTTDEGIPHAGCICRTCDQARWRIVSAQPLQEIA